MLLKTIIKKIEYKYPLNLAYDWDNVGLLVGDFDMNVEKVLVVLEANEKVIDEAIENNIDLIITHHPFIFKKMNKINTDFDMNVEKVLVVLEANEKVIDEAIENNIDLIITHHPFIFKKMNKINTMDLKGKLIHKLIKNDIALYSMHTNFDIAYDGLNDYFMKLMGFENSKVLEVTNTETLYKLAVYVPNTHVDKVKNALSDAGAGHIMKLMGFENSKVLEVTNTETLYKLAVYVPNTHVDKVKNALSDAGAGHIGNYSHCSFSSQGIGSFKPLDNANPYIGSLGEVELVEEVKIETIVPNKTLGGVISSMIKAHPYEEVAYDIYKLENKGNSVGLGRISKLQDSITLKELCNSIKEKLNMEHIRVVGNLNDKINKVAVVTGSGADMFKKAKRSGADVLITGDMKYHDAQDALDIGMNVIDCGHFDTEDIFKDAISIYLDDIEGIEVIKSNINLNPFKII